MTAVAVPLVKDQDIVQFGLVESASVNSITDFAVSKSDKSEVNTQVEDENFVNTFICHLIFYLVFCVSLALHILIDLGLGSFIKSKFTQLIGGLLKPGIKKSPAFA